MPPIREDPDAARRILQPSRATYQRHGLVLAKWLLRHGLRPDTADEWDDLLVEWKNMERIGRTAFQCTVASVELFFVAFRGKLQWSHQVIKGMQLNHTPKHTVPLISTCASFVAVQMYGLNFGRLGAGVVVQQSKGLRPTEMLSLRAKDVLLPEESLSNVVTGTVLNLGAKSGTKAKRSQAVVIDGFHPATILLRRVKALCFSEDQLLFPYSLNKYGQVLKKVLKATQLESVSWTPHSPRAGFASEERARGRSFTDIREDGRWVADSSLRVYIDVVASAQLEVDLNTRHLRDSIQFCHAHILQDLSPTVLAGSC